MDEGPDEEDILLPLAASSSSPFDPLSTVSVTVAVNSLTLICQLAAAAKVPSPPGCDTWKQYRQGLAGLPAGKIEELWAQETAQASGALPDKVRALDAKGAAERCRCTLNRWLLLGLPRQGGFS